MKSELEKELIQISKQLIRLNLQQQQLEKQLKEVQDKIEQDSRDQFGDEGIIHYRVTSRNKVKEMYNNANTRDTRLRYSTVTIRHKKAYDESMLPRIEDYVRIINPKSGQPNRGTIEGFCADGKAKICCARNIILTRQSKNLRYYVFG